MHTAIGSSTLNLIALCTSNTASYGLCCSACHFTLLRRMQGLANCAEGDTACVLVATPQQIADVTSGGARRLCPESLKKFMRPRWVFKAVDRSPWRCGTWLLVPWFDINHWVRIGLGL